MDHHPQPSLYKCPDVCALRPKTAGETQGLTFPYQAPTMLSAVTEQEKGMVH